MDIREKVTQSVIRNVADIFMKDEDYIAQNPDLNYLSDFAATSIDIYPLVSAFEDELDVELEYHDFQNNARTVSETVDYLVRKIEAQES